MAAIASSPVTLHVNARPLVSICVPTIGRVEYLKRALEGVTSQTYPNVDVIILDNASTESARGLIEAFAEANPRTTVLRAEERLPMFANFNRGVAAARGEYVAFFHDDDVYSPDFLARHIAALEEEPGAGFAGGNFRLIDALGQTVRIRRAVARSEKWSGRRFIADTVRRGRCALATPGLVFRKSAISAKGFDETLPINWGDFVVLMRIAEKFDVIALTDVTYSWRVHGANFSNMPFSSSIDLRTRILVQYCDEYAARHPDDTGFAARLRSYAVRSHLRGLVWGWFAATDDTDAVACLAQMRTSRRGRAISAVLAGLSRAGLSNRVRRGATPFLRRISEVVS